MNHDPRFRIILPTDEMVDEFSQADTLLGLIQTCVKDVVVYVANYWISHQEPWGEGAYSPLHALPGYLDVDFLHEYRYNSCDSRDIRDIRRVLNAIGMHVYLNIMPVLDVIQLNDFVAQALHCDGWAGNSLIVSTMGNRPYR